MRHRRKNGVVAAAKTKNKMPTIKEEAANISSNVRRNSELDELDEIEGEFLQFVLPWLKLVPQRSKDDVHSYKV